MVMSGCMMLDHLGEVEMSNKIKTAIAAVVKEGSSMPYDMLKLRGGPDALSQGAANTDEVADAIIAKL